MEDYVILTVGLPASKLGGVFPKGDMLLRELLLLLVLGMCFGVVEDKLFLPEADPGVTGGGREVTALPPPAPELPSSSSSRCRSASFCLSLPGTTPFMSIDCKSSG